MSRSKSLPVRFSSDDDEGIDTVTCEICRSSNTVTFYFSDRLPLYLSNARWTAMKLAGEPILMENDITNPAPFRVEFDDRRRLWNVIGPEGTDVQRYKYEEFARETVEALNHVYGLGFASGVEHMKSLTVVMKKPHPPRAYCYVCDLRTEHSNGLCNKCNAESNAGAP
jgi:hypothetical protein